MNQNWKLIAERFKIEIAISIVWEERIQDILVRYSKMQALLRIFLFILITKLPIHIIYLYQSVSIIFLFLKHKEDHKIWTWSDFNAIELFQWPMAKQSFFLLHVQAPMNENESLTKAILHFTWFVSNELEHLEKET